MWAGTRPRRYFLSGVMQGSDPTGDVGKLADQDYRLRISNAIRKAFPDAEIVDPLEFAKAKARRQSSIPFERYFEDGDVIKETFCEIVDLAGKSDVIISNLPEASMGSAVELWEARRNRCRCYTVTHMTGNWVVRTVSDEIFTSLQDFEERFADVESRVLARQGRRGFGGAIGATITWLCEARPSSPTSKL
eukprot:gnl/TRDRNA2_/TRDRNA2_28604_c0_seq1.p1 gnl/TRDRNA2_/TRDRNA2_28604_c0~~gnl/TRDRNA2_/TRDRNA2_28604_c0_seq1.p1  ORF type:complete len:191 (-),score=30.90 gnl/TRDRNA2_/TRDRNA2_28604_c0_seq1:93-665(-)